MGENKVTQSFRVYAREVWPPYTDPFTDVAEIEEFERRCIELEDARLITIRREKDNTIRAIQAIPEAILSYYTLLSRKEKRELDTQEMQMYLLYAEDKTVLGAFCRDQVSLLAQGKNAKYRMERAKMILALLKRIEQNKSELYERELSIQVLHDSKSFEKSYRRPVCNILRQYGDYESLIQSEAEDRLIQQIILEAHQIYANPEYVYVKGAAEILFQDGSVTHIKDNLPVAFSSAYVDAVKGIRPEAKQIMTIENLTSFHRFSEEGFFCIFLSGYHSTQITRLLHKMEQTERKSWYHFGDVDPDGFMILRNLRRKTGIDFLPFRMGVVELMQYETYCRKLEQKDIIKAKTLLEEGFYVDVIAYMLEHGLKLEQESVLLM